jgi:Ankyrin repeats (3 copies)
VAPEFFPFIACGVLAFVCIGLLAAALFIGVPRRLLQYCFPLVLRFLRPLLLALLLPAVGLLAVLMYEVRQQYFLNEPMAMACGDGDVDRVRDLLDRGASPDSWGIDFERPAIVYAAERGRIDTVKLLIDRGADPNARDMSGESALEVAQRNGHAEIGKLLRQAGAREGRQRANPPM